LAGSLKCPEMAFVVIWHYISTTELNWIDFIQQTGMFFLMWWFINETVLRRMVKECRFDIVLKLSAGLRGTMAHSMGGGKKLTVFKGHLEFSRLWSFILAMGGDGSVFWRGGLICSSSQHGFQVAELFDHRTMRTTWAVRDGGGWEQRRDKRCDQYVICYGNSSSDTVTCFLRTADFFYSVLHSDGSTSIAAY